MRQDFTYTEKLRTLNIHASARTSKVFDKESPPDNTFENSSKKMAKDIQKLISPSAISDVIQYEYENDSREPEIQLKMNGLREPKQSEIASLRQVGFDINSFRGNQSQLNQKPNLSAEQEDKPSENFEISDF